MTSHYKQHEGLVNAALVDWYHCAELAVGVAVARPVDLPTTGEVFEVHIYNNSANDILVALDGNDASAAHGIPMPSKDRQTFSVDPSQISFIRAGAADGTVRLLIAGVNLS